MCRKELVLNCKHLSILTRSPFLRYFTTFLVASRLIIYWPENNNNKEILVVLCGVKKNQTCECLIG